MPDRSMHAHVNCSIVQRKVAPEHNKKRIEPCTMFKRWAWGCKPHRFSVWAYALCKLFEQVRSQLYRQRTTGCTFAHHLCESIQRHQVGLLFQHVACKAHQKHLNFTEQHGHLAKVWSRKQAHFQLRLPHTVRQSQDTMLSVPWQLYLAREHLPTDATCYKITVAKAQ